MSLLRSHLRGVIHLLSASESNLPEVEFDGGEGPEQLMDQIQSFAVPLIRKAVHPVGPRLRWEEFDIERGQLRRHAYQLEDQVQFELSPDDQAIELLLPAEEKTDRIWVPLRALAQPGQRQLAALGWTVSKPRFYWRYVEIGQTPRLELSWHCDEIYAGWADLVRQRFPVIKCRLGNGRTCQMNLRREGPLFYRGHFQLSGDMWLPSRWRLTLRQPLVVVADEINAEAANTGELIDHDISVTARALDFRAVLPDRTTRLISDADLDQRFEAEVLTPEEILLPHEITGGLIPGLPWTLAVESAAVVVAAGPGHEEDPRPGPGRHRRWILRPLDEEGGYWSEVDWRKYPTVRFALGSANAEHATGVANAEHATGVANADHTSEAAAVGEAPEIARIDSRRATVGWRIETSEEEPDELLCFTIPHWVPMEGLEHVALPVRDQPYGDHGFEYASEVRAWLKGLEERFIIDPSSEMSANRIFLDPRRWRFYDETHGDIKDAEALGEVSGYVRWRRPEPDEGSERPYRGREVTPTDWAAGPAPVLLVQRVEKDPLHHGGNIRCWGGLYVPESIPWEALQEVRPERAGDQLLLIPRSTLPALWISLWGFLCRYDRHRVIFSQRAPQTLNAWIAGTGLELFPADREDQQMDSEGAGRGFLIRSFAPLYAVRDSDPRIFSLETAAPRPFLRLGRELHEPEGPRSLEIGESTFVRFQITDLGQVPESFGPGRIPNTPLHLSLDPHRQTVWFALEQRSPDIAVGQQSAGYLLSWDRLAGWRFRGFFAHPDAAVALGQILLPGAGETVQVMLGDESRAGRQAFRLTLDAEGHQWGENTPERIVEEVNLEMIDAWEQRYYDRDSLPPPMADFEMRIVRQPVDDGPRIFEFLPRENASVLDPPPGIRVWEPQEGTDETFLTGTRVLGIPDLGTAAEPEPPKAPVPEPPSLRPRKKMLKADEDDDEDFC